MGRLRFMEKEEVIQNINSNFEKAFLNIDDTIEKIDFKKNIK